MTKERDIRCVNCRESLWADMWSGTSLDYTDEHVYKVKYCKKCGLARTFPFPTKEEAMLSYTKGAYSSKSLFPKIVDFLASVLERRKLRKIKYLTQGRNLLDIGTGKGRFVRVASNKNWTAYGYEPYQKPDVNSKYRNLFFRGDIDSLPLKENSMDVVTMWHVLEHTPDPLKAIRSAKKYLKENGVLLIAVPNIESINARISKGLWYHLDVPRHLWHFSPKSLNSLISSTGLEVVRINYFATQSIMGLWMSIGNLMKCAYNYPWNFLRLNQNMLQTVSIWRLMYSTIIHTLLFISLPILYLINVVLCMLKLTDTVEIYAVNKRDAS